MPTSEVESLYEEDRVDNYPTSDVETVETEKGDAFTRDIIASLDDKTDEIYSLRRSFVSMCSGIRSYLRKDEEGRTVSLVKALEKVEDGATLDSIFDFRGIDGERRDDVLVRANIALDKRRKLITLGGNFAGQNFKNKEEDKIGPYYRYRLGIFDEDKEVITGLEDQIEILEQKKAFVKSQAQQRTLPQETVVARTKMYDNEIKSASEKIKNLTNTPEGFLYVYGKRLKVIKECLDNHGRIVETPYVKSKMRTVIDSLKTQPVFIHGELGSGKTEIAKHIARKMILEQWEKDNPMPKDGKDLSIWEINRTRKAQEDLIVISGHKGIEPDVMTGARTIERIDPLTPEEQIEMIEQKWQEYVKENNSLATDKDTFVRVYLEAFKSPVEVNVKLGPLMKAIEEGKPVIIDEMNAIPHTVLIMLNDLITKRVGETVTLPIPGAKPVQIKEGFAVIATGNYKPEDGRVYVGRQAIDAAFLSRFSLVSYDYLPNNTSIEPEGLSAEESRVWRQENELMGMLITKMLDKDLSLAAPENAFKQIEKLSFVARNIQNVFSGKTIGDEWYGKGPSGAKVSPENLLEENVLSIRHLLPIVDQWRSEGFSKSLDYYLFTNYVARSGARPAEKRYLYGILQTMGDFFNEEDGWPSRDDSNALASMDESILKFITEKPLRTHNVVSYSVFDVIEKLYGKRPERDAGRVPTSIFKAPTDKPTEIPEELKQAREKTALLEALNRMGAETVSNRLRKKPKQ